jgi:hypothetical protein
MLSPRGVEVEIREVERIFISVFDLKGKPLSDEMALPPYPYHKAAPCTWTLAEWKKKRFDKVYPKIKISVFTISGAAHPSDLIGNIRFDGDEGSKLGMAVADIVGDVCSWIGSKFKKKKS